MGNANIEKQINKDINDCTQYQKWDSIKAKQKKKDGIDMFNKTRNNVQKIFKHW